MFVGGGNVQERDPALRADLDLSLSALGLPQCAGGKTEYSPPLTCDAAPAEPRGHAHLGGPGGLSANPTLRSSTPHQQSSGGGNYLNGFWKPDLEYALDKRISTIPLNSLSFNSDQQDKTQKPDRPNIWHPVPLHGLLPQYRDGGNPGINRSILG